MKEFNYNDKKYTRVGVVLILIVLIGITVANYFWSPKPQLSLACLSVQSRINNLIELEQKTKEWGAPTTQKSHIEQQIKQALKDNAKLKCGFNEDKIRKQFNL